MDRMILVRDTPIGKKSLSPSKFTNQISAWIKRENKGGKIMVPWLARRARPAENNVDSHSPPQDENDMVDSISDMDSASSLSIAEPTQSHINHLWSCTAGKAFNDFQQYQTRVSSVYSTVYYPRAYLAAHATNSVGVESIYTPGYPFNFFQENIKPWNNLHGAPTPTRPVINIINDILGVPTPNKFPYIFDEP